MNPTGKLDMSAQEFAFKHGMFMRKCSVCYTCNKNLWYNIILKQLQRL